MRIELREGDRMACGRDEDKRGGQEGLMEG